MSGDLRGILWREDAEWLRRGGKWPATGDFRPAHGRVGVAPHAAADQRAAGAA